MGTVKAFQPDPGPGEWDGGVGVGLSPSSFVSSAGCFCLPVYATQKLTCQKKRLFVGWVWNISLMISLKQISKRSFNNKHVSSSCLCVLAQPFEFMESCHMASQKRCYLKCICFSNYRYIYFLAQCSVTFIYLYEFPFSLIQIYTTWMNEWKHSRHPIQRVYCTSSGLTQKEAMCCTLAWSLKPSAAPDRKHSACRRVFPWKPKQVRALTGRRVRSAGKDRGWVGGGDWRMRSAHLKACHIKHPKSPNGSTTKNNSWLKYILKACMWEIQSQG